ncbi:hypothetical protein [Mycolicibacterium helvum]|uniref:hypothetical protein n=1 Tax=Mycolicibacterium helvum TaxID=1534349 RepID=UPI0013CFF834|nr:hypothetical protein [Mycolicibacterium helvum]
MPEFHEFHPIGGGNGGVARLTVVVGEHAERTAVAALITQSRWRKLDLLFSMTRTW